MNSLKNTRPRYSLRKFLFCEKSAVLKVSSRSRLPSKSTWISRKMEGENTTEKSVKVFRAYWRILLWWSEVICLLYIIVAPRVRDS